MPGQKKILFRADGDGNTGLGHLYRLFALVEIYKKQFQFIFVTKASSTKTIFPKDYHIFLVPEDITINDEPLWLHQNFNPSEHLIIADGYQFKSDYHKQLKDYGYHLIYIDDLVEGKLYADVIVNHAANVEPSNYQVQPYTRFALGTEYAILRPLFVKAAQSERHINGTTNAFVCFGGADALDLSYKATKALLETEKIKSIHVVLGAAYKHSDIEALATQNTQIKLYRNLDEHALCNLMKSCDLAVAPSSTIVYELCTVKMPILSGYFVDNQISMYNALLQKGAIEGAGDLSTSTVQDFKTKLNIIINQKQLGHYLKAQQKLFDGQSSNRFIKLLNDFLVTFRKATKEDMLLVYNWSNDPLVRQNSYNTKEIDLANHEKWFNQKINGDKTLFLIALFDNQPAGVVRYEIKEDHTIIGVLVSEKFRGKKLSPSFLSESAKYYFKQNHLPIFAYIKEGNKASIKAFESAGYDFYKKEPVKEMPSFVYKLEKKDVKE
ncbi:UDP-2,4-diacetamido-2,4,6-trideoxy-beta-L-altropyranose hydrolase [Changchengzhania lutea]|uniref:UDP-2,4-diacetamido-2,4, 6-trideoxy-beta-L-altropyranose hydrolase n=1 Tax=Changchengzhania lutea TaxID=2049305 RepID=UPI00115EABF2|nr:UDP-2,4-diacetamido-2,4,6-trideoxy-beta-L-altropyranose hydrolase [Changchengzhania lutea]